MEHMGILHETNVAPENDEIPKGKLHYNHQFSGAMLVSWSVFLISDSFDEQGFCTSFEFHEK